MTDQWGCRSPTPETALGTDYIEHRVSRQDVQGDADGVVGVINPMTGSLDLYRLPAPAEVDSAESDSTPTEASDNDLSGPAGDRQPAPKANGASKGKKAGERPATGAGEESEADKTATEARAAATAQARRREACAALIHHQPSNADLLKVLVRQCLSGVSARSQTAAVKTLLRDWDAVVEGTGEKARNTRAWHIAVAAAEAHTADLTGEWDDEAVAHLELLTKRVGYQPTEWENRRLREARG
ncbi:parB-like partition domain protein [Mycobacterium avium subsp. avium 2285 (R)]|nr:parB-like partition domain protein [Mycobacterium avium subsp. avium 2285 (R)]